MYGSLPMKFIFNFTFAYFQQEKNNLIKYEYFLLGQHPKLQSHLKTFPLMFPSKVATRYLYLQLPKQKWEKNLIIFYN